MQQTGFDVKFQKITFFKIPQQYYLLSDVNWLFFPGIHCDDCAENYYGDPINPGGSCDSCMCNNNINLDAPGNCDADSGECLLCLYDTEGFSCEKCAPGFFGDATMQNCQSKLIC